MAGLRFFIRVVDEPEDSFKVLFETYEHDVVMCGAGDDNKLLFAGAYVFAQCLGLFKRYQSIVFAMYDENRCPDLADHVKTLPVDGLKINPRDRYAKMNNEPGDAGETAFDDESPDVVLLTVSDQAPFSQIHR